MKFKSKKVLLMGLGILGGGAATTRWLVEQGAVLTVTDMKNEEALKISLEKLNDIKNKINFVLGEHREEDFLNNEIIVLNQDIPFDNKFVEIARQAGKRIENELTLFYAFSKSKNIIAITGTRGKTTTANWTAHFLKSINPNTFLIGNSPDKPLLQEIKNVSQNSLVVLEVPSFNLEIVDGKNFKPHIAIITSLYLDHLNRHKTVENYAATKANIFKGQTSDDFLILDGKSDWTKFFLDFKPKSKVLFYDKQDIFSEDEMERFTHEWGKHNFKNLLAAGTAALAAGCSLEKIKALMLELPQIKFREEKIFENDKISIYNDTTATSPEASLAAMERFHSDEEKVVFIIGGTDRELDFKQWAIKVQGLVKPEDIIFLSGSATEKMKKELAWSHFNEFDTLEECFKEALKIVESKLKSKIIFSPGAKSFEKFKNEFDRGEKFNALVEEKYK
jgi:UDP-N-acetylmuramoylalanine--D-glutamate ligase